MMVLSVIIVETENISSSREAQVAAHLPWLAILSLVCSVQYVIVSHFLISEVLVILIRQLMYCRCNVLLYLSPNVVQAEVFYLTTEVSFLLSPPNLRGCSTDRQPLYIHLLFTKGSNKQNNRKQHDRPNIKCKLN